MLLTKIKYIARKNDCFLFPYSESECLRVAFGIYDDSEESSAICFYDKNRDSKRFIFYDDRLDRINQAFAVAHELGHIKLNHKKDNRNQQQEDEADRYAVNIIKSIILNDKPQKVKKYSRSFAVNYKAPKE